jgi:hypothetical protein
MAEYKHRKLANSIEIKQSMQQRMQFMEDMERMIADLKQLGFDTETPDRMFSNLDECKQALPVFLKWIELMESTDTTEMLVRYVTVPWAKKVAVQPLIARLKKERNTKNESLKWAIGNALNLTADKSNREELLKIVQDIVYGGARQMIILRLGTMKVRDSEDVLIPLLEQEDVRGHTIAALGYIGSLKAKPYIEKYLNDPNKWFQKQARNAIMRIDKANNEKGGAAKVTRIKCI